MAYFVYSVIHYFLFYIPFTQLFIPFVIRFFVRLCDIVMFRSLRIVIYPYNTNQQDALFIYFQFISIINLYIFRVGLLLNIKRYYSVYSYTAIGMCIYVYILK
jgi:hypothetical protein